MLNAQEISDVYQDIAAEVEHAIIGKPGLIKNIIAAILAGGHILLEDYPGLGKTILSKSIAKATGLRFSRIQFTPDLLPADITGSYVYNRIENKFEFRMGPIFSNIILADEINRASPKTQSALLEAMQERQVTVDGRTKELTEPFVVIATQNPIEYEGTFPLPEAQLDRFLVKLGVGYPDLVQEVEILERRRKRQQDMVDIINITDVEKIIQMRQVVENVYVEKDIDKYIVEIVHSTRDNRKVLVGASPRGSLSLMKISRAYAALEGREFVIPDDVKRFIKPTLAHRIILVPELWMHPNAEMEILDQIINSITVPIFNN
ncbi:MAG: AAA family ATPase [Anaerolineales bacterium]|jgi:MoxR-like ATPase